jgi:catechol 2,3-dioxygenase-like lactoylglutathione lyase family enzyme
VPSLTVIEEPVKVHMAVNVADLTRSVAFYRVLFGVEPAKCHADYAKFEVADPPLVFSLMPGGPGAGGPMSHAGLRVADAAAVWAARDRLEAAGIPTRSQTDTRGCYAVQTKVWATDPDGALWEVYVLMEDIPHGDVTGTAPGGDLGPAGGSAEVLYKGPFRDLSDDDGRVFTRGRRVAVPADVWEALRQGPGADEFVFFEPAAAPAACH